MRKSQQAAQPKAEPTEQPKPKAPTPSHAAAALFPDIDSEAFAAMVGDMQAKGFDEKFPILRWQKQVVDGRNRERAAFVAGVEPSYKDLPDNADPWNEALRANVQRRHLDADQRAALYLKVAKNTGELKKLEGEHKAAANKARGKRGKGSAASRDAALGKLSHALAARAGVSPATIERVQRLSSKQQDEVAAGRAKAARLLATANGKAPKQKAVAKKADPAIVKVQEAAAVLGGIIRAGALNADTLPLLRNAIDVLRQVEAKMVAPPKLAEAAKKTPAAVAEVSKSSTIVSAPKATFCPTCKVSSNIGCTCAAKTNGAAAIQGAV